MKLETLVTTMNQSGFELYSRMNMSTDAVIANQADHRSYAEYSIDNHSVRFITTDTIGVSRNRNIALAHSSQSADILLFVDDDVVFFDGYEERVVSEFEKHPFAEAIKFNIEDISATRKVSMKKTQSFSRATRRNMSSSGVVVLAIKRECLIKSAVFFNEHFGPGTENYCGEDTIFINELLNKRIKMYRSPECIAEIDQTESSWFKGYTDKYFQTVGTVLNHLYPCLSRLIAIRSAYKFSKRKECALSFFAILHNYYVGMKAIRFK